MAKKQTIELQILTNAKMILGELRLLNAEMHNIRHNQQQMNVAHTKGAAASKSHSSAMTGLALKFVGYNLILNQVMGAQQKLVQLIQESVKAYREFETRLAEISTILGSDQLPLMGRLKAGIENLSMAYGQATSDMSKGMYDILSAAFAAEGALNLLTTATKASIAGLSNIRTSTDIFTTVLNTYGMQVEQATNVSNILFQSVIRGKFQFEDLGHALGYIVPIAAQAGIAFNEMMAALSTATRHGLHLDMASRGLALGIQGIINPTEKTTKAAEKYGIEVGDLAMRVLGLHGWFQELNDATKEFGKSIIGELIPNVRSLRVAMVLAGDVGLAGFNDDLIELINMGDSTETALKKIMNTSQFVSSQLTQQWEQVKREVGEDWDELVLNIQRGILAIADILTIGTPTYVSKAGEGYTFIEDDDIHNALEYMRIAKDITALEDERSKIEKATPIKEEELAGLFPLYEEATEQFKTANNAAQGFSRTIKEVNIDIAAAIEAQGQFVDAFNTLKGGILDGIDVIGNLELTLDNIELAIRELDDELLKTFVYGFKDASGAMKEASISISDLTTLTQEQRDALSSLGDTIKGNLAYQYMALHSQREYADATHDVEMGLKVAGYAYKEIPADIQAAVDATRNYTKAQKENTETTARMTAEMRHYQIQLLELQLKGMSRRRGLTRSEEKQIKVIQIAQATARLENMKGQKAMLETDVSTNQTNQQLIDDYILKLKEKQYELKYTYDQQVVNLELAISREGEKLTTRYEWWETTNQKIIDNVAETLVIFGELTDETRAKLLEEEIDVAALEAAYIKLNAAKTAEIGTYIEPEPEPEPTPPMSTESAHKAIQRTFDRLPPILQERFRDKGIFKLAVPQYQGGIHYVPETGPAIVHRGETIGPAGRESPSGITIGNVTIAVKEIADIDDIEKLSALLSQAESSGLMKRGKTNYRLRMG